LIDVSKFDNIDQAEKWGRGGGAGSKTTCFGRRHGRGSLVMLVHRVFLSAADPIQPFFWAAYFSPILFSINSRADLNGNGEYDFLIGSTFMHDNAQKS
jgi:hypothetical protein